MVGEKISSGSMVRLDYIDIAKCLGMFTIIWGHIIHEGWSNQIVYAFHIPLFFFLSGMVYKAEKYPSVWTLVKKRWKTLILPYLIFSFATWLLWVGLRIVTHDPVNYWQPLLQTFIAQGSVGFLRHNLPLWFVLCLFSVEILFYFINKLSKYLSVSICITLSLIGCYIEFEGGALRTLPWSLDGALVSLLFYGSGYWLVHYFTHQKLLRIISKNIVFVLVSITVLFIVLYFTATYNGYVTIGFNSLGNNVILFYLNSYMGIAAMLMLCICISTIKIENQLTSHIMSYIKWFGRNSFYVMATHFPIKELTGRMVNKLFNCDAHVDIAYAALVFVITLVVDSVIVWICCWIKSKWNEKNWEISPC